MIKIEVDGSVVSVQETEALYCGAQDVHTCFFSFDESWEKYSKSAVFRVNGKAITAVIDENNTCILPWELLARDNIGLEIDVGVYGVSADAEILTSVWDSIGMVREGSELGGDAREPSAGVYEQVMASVQRVDGKVTSYSAEMQTLVQRAESAAVVASETAARVNNDAAAASSAAVTAVKAKTAVEAALNNIPEGSTLVINDLTTGGTSAALSAEQGKVLGQRPNPNLFINWYFANAVNQRGKTEFTVKNEYTVDRWKKSGDTAITLADGYISFAAGAVLQHPLEPKVISAITGVPVTFSLLMDTGLVYGTAAFDGKAKIFYGDTTTAVQLRISGNGHPYIMANTAVNIVAAKLELGSIQTLAHQDADGNWVLNEIPDYNEELLKCCMSRADSADAYANKTILHTGNMPSGIYKGTSDATEQIIDTKGIGKGVYIYGGVLGAIIGPNGGIAWNTSGGAMETIDYASAHFANGILTIATDSFYLNSSSVTYTYHVI